MTLEVVKRLHDKLDFIDMARGVCHVGNIPYEDVYFSSRYLEGVYCLPKEHRCGSPNKPPRVEK